MVTIGDVVARLDECGQEFTDFYKIELLIRAVLRGDVVIIMDFPDKKRYVGAYAKEKCKPLPLAFPKAFPPEEPPSGNG